MPKEEKKPTEPTTPPAPGPVLPHPVENEGYSPDEGGLFDKYTVTRNADQKVLDGGTYFVLRVNDPHARNALRIYAESCRPYNEALANDLMEMVDAFELRQAAIESLRKVATMVPSVSGDIDSILEKV